MKPDISRSTIAAVALGCFLCGAAVSLGAQQQIIRTTPPLAGRGTLVGIIVAPGGRPVDSASVAIADPRRETKTGADGIFRFSRVPSGEFDLVVRKVGFVPQRTRMKIDSGGGSIRMVLQPLPQTLPASVTEAELDGFGGVVGDTAFRAIPGATVTLVASGAGSTTTDSLGAFYLPAKPGHYAVTIRKKGYLTQMASVTIPPKGGKRMSLLMTPGAPATAARESFYLDNLRERRLYASGPFSKLLTREDIARMGSEDLRQVATLAAVRRVDEDCNVSLDGSPEFVPVWALDLADIEFLEVYASAGAYAKPGTRQAAGVTSINGNRPIRTQELSARARGGNGTGCPQLIAWLRR
jgi:hypothetical protein